MDVRGEWRQPRRRAAARPDRQAEAAESPEVNDTLGFIYYKKNLPALAIPPLKMSVEKDPNNPMFHYHLGLAYAKAEDVAQARQSLMRALELKPDFAGAADAKTVLTTLGS